MHVIQYSLFGPTKKETRALARKKTPPVLIPYSLTPIPVKKDAADRKNKVLLSTMLPRKTKMAKQAVIIPKNAISFDLICINTNPLPCIHTKYLHTTNHNKYFLCHKKNLHNHKESIDISVPEIPIG